MNVLYHGTGAYPCGQKIGPACWPHWDILIALRGKITMSTGRRKAAQTHSLEEGDALLIPPGKYFHGKGETPEAMLWVLHFEDAIPTTRVKVFRQVVNDAFGRGLLTEIARIFNAHQTPAKGAYLNALGAALLQRLRSAKPGQFKGVQPDRRLRFHRIEEIESLHGISLPSATHLAAEAGLSPSQHRVLFARQYGVTPREHLKQLRIIVARRLLKETRVPIKEVASVTGYGEVASFHRAFVAACGCTPAQFRTDHPLAS